MKKVILSIGGMSCSACSSSLEKYLNKQNGVISASVNLVLAQALIEYEEDLSIKDLERFVKECGFISLGEYKGEDIKNTNKRRIINLIIFGVLSLVVMCVSMSHMINLPSLIDYPKVYAITLFCITIPFLVYGIDIFKKGIKSVIHRSFNMDTLVTLGVWSSFIYSFVEMILILCDVNVSTYVKSLYFESSAIVIFFIKLGRYLDTKSKEKTKEAIKELVQITPKSALVLEDGNEVEKSIDEVNVDDILILKPGMKVAVDGEVVKGESHIDESFISGESKPVKKGVGDMVVAGAINSDGYIEYKAKRIGKDSTISEIVRLVVEASNTKAPISRMADKVSGYFVPGVMIVALLTFIVYLLLGFDFSVAIKTFVTVLVVACPCALGLATPLAIVVSEGECAKNGILVKSGAVLESSSYIDSVVFDKTGTLTYGNLRIATINNYGDMSEDELLVLVGSLETKSSHPISSSFMNEMSSRGLKKEEIEEFENISGVGLKGKCKGRDIIVGNNKIFDIVNIENKYVDDEKKISEDGCSIVYVIIDKKVVALIGVKDVLREESRDTILKLKDMGVNVYMLTGDNEKTSSIVANEVGIDNVKSSMMPKDKVEYIKHLATSSKVMMVGDGINDAPSLVSATVGVSVSSGTDIAADSADVILMRNDISYVVSLLEVSKRTIKVIKQNLFWAFFYNVCMIPIAMGVFRSFGLTISPMIGSLAMMLSSLSVVFNALRLKKWK